MSGGTANTNLVLRMQAKGGSQVKSELEGTRGQVKKLDTELVAASKRGERAMGLFGRSAGGLRSAFSGAARGGIGAFSQIESAAKRSTGRISGFIGNTAKGLGKLGKGGAVGIAAGVAGFFGVEAVKSAVEGVQTLAESTAVLHNVVGLSVDAAARLGAVANATGVDNRKLGMSLKTLASTTTNALSGTKSSVLIFKSLGISMHDLRKTGGDTMKVFDLVTQRLDKMHGGVAKTNATAKLFGRGWMTLNPLLEDGGKEMRSLTKFAASLGITLSGNTGKNLAKARDASYRFKLVMMAVQLFIVNKLVPALLKIAAWLNARVIPAFRWFGKSASAAIKWVGTAAQQTERWVVNAFNNVVRFFSGLPGKISHAATGLWDGLKSGLIVVINWVIGKLDWFIRQYNSVVGSIPLVGGSLTVGQIGMIGPGGATGRAAGGAVTNSGNAVANALGASAPNTPPIIPGGKVRKNVARAGTGAAVVHQVVVNPVPVHASFHWNNREVAKVVKLASAEAKAVR